MKKTKTLCLLLVLCMLLGCSAMAASGEASGEPASRLVSISGGSMSVSDDGDYELEGELGVDAKDVSGIRFVAGSAKQSFLSVTNSTHIDPLKDGFTAVLGGEENYYPLPDFSEVYSNDGLNPNTEGFELDYGWINQIAPDGSISAITPAGQTLLGELLGAHEDGFNVYIEGGSRDDERSSRGPTQVSVSGGAALLVENAYIYSEGLEGLAISNNGTSGVGSTMVVRDSVFATRGYVPMSQDVSENLPNDPLLVTGADRTSLSGGESVTYYYDSAVVTDGWASLSTDGASGEGVDLIGVNTFASALLGGYGTYADGNCRDYFYGSVLEGAEIGVIIAGTGEVNIFDGDEGAEGGTGYSVGKNGQLTPYAFADEADAERYAELGGSAVAGGRWGVLIHTAGSAAIEPQGVFYAKDSSIITDRALYSDENTENSVNASWYGRELSPNIQKYIEYTEGADFLIRSSNAQIVLDGVELESYSGVLVHSVLNNDTSTPETPAGSNAAGTSVYLVDMTAEGDILDEDYERVMNITLDSANLTGRIVSTSCAEWTGKWLAMGYAEDYTIGLGSNTFGSEAPLDAFVHALAVGEDGTVTYTPYGDDQGTTLSLLNGAIWTVTGESRLSSLTLDSRSEVNGVFYVDGVQTAIEPGVYEGELVLRPASASGEMAE